MELILNLGWLLVAAGALAGWGRAHCRTGGHWGRQFLTLAVLLFILFPAISITDDLWVTHHPAETDSVVRRSEHVIHFHGMVVRAPAFLVSRFHPPTSVLRSAAGITPEVTTAPDAPAHLNHFIRPPPIR